MALHILAVALLACLPLLAQAAFTAEESALRNAVTASGARTYTLTKNIVLTADLPFLADGKVLKVQSPPGAQYTINGQNKYSLFRTAGDVVYDVPVDLTLVRLIITGAKEAVNIGGEGAKLNIDTVKFDKNDRALTLDTVNGNVVNSQFIKHKKGAIVIQSIEGNGDSIKFTKCNFISNTAERGFSGGAIRVNLYASITAERCFFSKNTAGLGGGAVSSFRGLVIIKKSNFDSNSAKRYGGAISLFRADAQVSDTTFNKNSADAVGGGAVRVSADDEGGSFAIFKNVVFSRNKAKTTMGGAFLLDSAAIQICNSRFSSNLGNGAINNGFVTGPDNIIVTRSGETLPLVSVAPSAGLTMETAECP